MARFTNVFRVPPGASTKKLTIRHFVVHCGLTQGLEDDLMTHLEDCSLQQHKTQLSVPHSISESPHRPLAAVSQCQVLAPLTPLSEQGGHLVESGAGIFPK